MNNLLSLNWLQEFVRLSVPPQELARRLSLVGAGVERVHKMGENLNGIVVGRIKKIENHPNAQALRVCRVSDGRAEKTIVCGGSNVRVGMFVALALPGSFVRWHGTGDPVEIKETELRGVKSAGMICASNEIGLGELFPAEEREIMDVGALRVGAPLAEALGTRDTVFDIEATSNRPDLMSVIGVAREVVACGAGTFIKRREPKIPSTKKRVAVAVKEKKLCPRYMAARVDGVRVGPSPLWIQQRLVSAGVRPINNIVDITNFVRVEWGQPMHAFDADLVRGTLTIRRAHEGEIFMALDGTTHQLTDEMVVIADSAEVCAVAGVMGGAKSGVTERTKNIIFEAATFDGVSVRRTARALNLFSDSQLLFEKGLSVQAPEQALARAIQLTHEISGGTVTATADSTAQKYKQKIFAFDFASVAPFLGVEIPVARMKKILQSLGFVVSGAGNRVRMGVPWWREHDIENPVDFTEEIARVYGYHNLPSQVPLQKPIQRAPDPVLRGETDLRAFFAAHGFRETYSYSFINEDLLARAGLKKLPALHILNPLTTDFTVMRPSLLPSALATVAQNEPHTPVGAIFEVANTYAPDGSASREQLRAIVVRWSADERAQDFFALKGVIENLCAGWGIADAFHPTHTYREPHLHPARQLVLMHAGSALGMLGEVHPDITERFGIRGRVTVCDIDVAALVKVRRAVKSFSPLSLFPPVKRDIAVVVDAQILHDDVVSGLRQGSSLLAHVEFFDVYHGSELGAHKKSMAFHLEFSAPDRTLTTAEVDEQFARVVAEVKKRCGATIRE